MCISGRFISLAAILIVLSHRSIKLLILSLDALLIVLALLDDLDLIVKVLLVLVHGRVVIVVIVVHVEPCFVFSFSLSDNLLDLNSEHSKGSLMPLLQELNDLRHLLYVSFSLFFLTLVVWRILLRVKHPNLDHCLLITARNEYLLDGHEVIAHHIVRLLDL